MRAGEMMKKNLILKGLCVFLFLFAYQASVQAAPACKGPNKNNPGCGEETAPVVAAAVVDSVTVDWFNQALIVRGSGLAGATTFVLGNSAALGVASVADTELDIPFSTDMATEVTSQGNYNLVVDGTVQLSVFMESLVIDQSATDCPCETDWASELGSLWGPPLNTTDCLETAHDIAGTIDDTDFSFVIGASFSADPDSSVCRLVQINKADASTEDLVNLRINENQQADCAAVLNTYICTP